VSGAAGLAYEQAQEEAGKDDPRRLLPARTGQSPSRGREHWVEVYREPVETKSAMLAKLREDRRGLAAASEAELDDRDVPDGRRSRLTRQPWGRLRARR
jgi:hypothetical protein